ncbi:MAG: UDP-N-acetylmuramate--L-alanine ligase [Acidobacteria bacterium]|nr:UDP-N-acetylmuramate--L-alanine ligase [Acidobacteriota bacterium]MBV8890454.1 UDP-N-acetylmuramate--L-alanine ligase [Acidobacteriota bacterium]MBV9480762.1 UDP-N-acetylmuramate--L-alanine ligase [Acidobacteriota bacterium]
MFAKIQRVHFVGIGGIGMSGIAEVLLTLGYKVSGSDLKNSPVTERLARLGAIIFEGHKAENVSAAEVVVTSSAIAIGNPEVEEARRQRVPVIPRAEMLAELMRLKYGIAVAGMHGKTTTTSMIAAVLAGGGLDPTVVVGGRVDAMGSGARLGKSQYLVAEADESDRSFLKLSPILAVVTNIDREHMDTYRNMRDVKNSFLEFMNRVPFYGMVVASQDDPLLTKLLPQVGRRTVTYGTRRGSDFHITLRQGEHTRRDHRPHSRFLVRFADRPLGEFTLGVPGIHNVRNATAAIAVGVGLDIAVDEIRQALHSFRGVDRRFELRGHAGGIAVVDDYGHHPTEIKATLAAARQCGYEKIHVIFQPHRYTRTRDLLAQFARAFLDADHLIVVDIYPAGEQPMQGVTAELLVEQIRRQGHRAVCYARSFEEASMVAISKAREGDLLLTLGAGNVYQVAPMILEKIHRAQSVGSAR